MDRAAGWRSGVGSASVASSRASLGLQCPHCSPGTSAISPTTTRGAVVGLMMWMWLSTIVVLVSAELNSEIEHQTARDSTVGPEKPLGTLAVMADTVGAAVT